MALEALDVTFGYDRPLFEHLSLCVAPGERVALSAPSGRGKSSLCRLLAGYERPWAGSVSADGVDASCTSCAAYGALVQLLWQQPQAAFDPLRSLGFSLTEAGDPSSEHALDLMRRLRVDASWLARRPRELSGGELMRLAIVRALLACPRYLIADESTAMLDVITQARVWRELLAEARELDLGLVVVSHDPSLLDLVAMRTYVLPASISAEL